jgi:hypothetical protein
MHCSRYELFFRISSEVQIFLVCLKLWHCRKMALGHTIILQIAFGISASVCLTLNTNVRIVMNRVSAL